MRSIRLKTLSTAGEANEADGARPKRLKTPSPAGKARPMRLMGPGR